MSRTGGALSLWRRLVRLHALSRSIRHVRIKILRLIVGVDLRWLVLLGLLLLQIISFQLLGEFSIHAIQTSGRDIGISLDNSQRILKSRDSVREHSSALSNLWGLS